MSVDVSNRRFYFNESPTLESKSISGSFTSKSPAGNYGQRWGRILVSTTDIRYYYLSGSYVQVYSSGAWLNDEYRVIVFAPDTSLLDYEYEWLAANSTEVTPYFTSNESLGQVANAIRERGWTRDLLVYPDGYDAAIRAIGNYAEGATVAWNQQITNGNFESSSGWLASTEMSFTVADNVATINVNSSSSSLIRFFRTINAVTVGHSYLMCCDRRSSTITSCRIYNPCDNTTLEYPVTSSFTTTYIITKATNSGSQFQPIRFNGSDTKPVGESIDIRNCMLIDLTVLLGADVADQIYALEQDTAGAGVAVFKALFSSDYYQSQLTPVLSTVNYHNSFPINDPVELPGVMRLDSDSNIVRYGDIYNDGKLYKRYVKIALDGLTWTYNSTFDFFYANPVGPDSASVTGPYASDLFINAISDYLPLTLWDYGTLTESQLASADDGMYLCYISTAPAAAINLLYIKDSTITSDHENTLLGKLAGKTIVMTLTNPYYTTT